MQCFGRFNMLSVHKCSDTPLTRHLSNIGFCSLPLRLIFFFSKYSKLYANSGIAEKIEKFFFDLEKIAFELVALTTRFS